MKMTLIIAADTTIGELFNLVARHTAIDDAHSEDTLKVHTFVMDCTGHFEVEFRGSEAELASLRREYIINSQVGSGGVALEAFIREEQVLFPILPLVDVHADCNSPETPTCQTVDCPKHGLSNQFVGSI